MRIGSVRVSNFRGIREATLDGIGESAVVTVSGPNGAGKSLLFEALTLLWRLVPLIERNQLLPAALVGPWGNTTEIGVTVVLADDEIEALRSYLNVASDPSASDVEAIA